MDGRFFGLKRAFHSTLRISRRDFKAFGNTPARMDILYALYNRKQNHKAAWQSSLRRVIGYTARSTMTEIMKALEALGLIKRRRSQEDKRQLEVRLTRAGRAEIHAANHHFSGWWTVEAPSRAMGWGTPTWDEAKAWDDYIAGSGRLEGILRDLRFALRDTGRLHYEWDDG